MTHSASTTKAFNVIDNLLGNSAALLQLCARPAVAGKGPFDS